MGAKTGEVAGGPERSTLYHVCERVARVIHIFVRNNRGPRRGNFKSQVPKIRQDTRNDAEFHINYDPNFKVGGLGSDGNYHSPGRGANPNPNRRSPTA